MIEGYRLDFCVQSGQSYDLFKAHETASGAPCLIKVCKAGGAYAQSFVDEANLAATLFHPNLVDVYQAGVLDNGDVFVASEDAEGDTLRDFLSGSGVPKLLASIEIIRQAAEALHVLHLAGLTHRAVNPYNIILKTDAKGGTLVRLRGADFGGLGQRSVISNKFAIDGALDSLRYFAPEQCSSEESDARTDVYSLGIVFYELLAGASPFDATSATELIHKQRNQSPPEVRIDNFDLRMLVTHSLTESLQKPSRLRQASANVLARQLRHIEQLATHSSTPPPAGTVKIPAPGRLFTPAFRSSAPPTPAQTQPVESSVEVTSEAVRVAIEETQPPAVEAAPPKFAIALPQLETPLPVPTTELEPSPIPEIASPVLLPADDQASMGTRHAVDAGAVSDSGAERRAHRRSRLKVSKKKLHAMAAQISAEREVAAEVAARSVAAEKLAAEKETGRRLAAEQEAQAAAERDAAAKIAAEKAVVEKLAAEREVARKLAADAEAQLTAEREAAHKLAAEAEAQLAAEREAAKLAAEREAQLTTEREAVTKLAAHAEAQLAAEREAAAKLAAETEARLACDREAAAKLAAETEAQLAAEKEAIARLAAEKDTQLAAEKEARLAAERDATVRLTAERETAAKLTAKLEAAERKAAERDAAAQRAAAGEAAAKAAAEAMARQLETLRIEMPTAVSEPEITNTDIGERVVVTSPIEEAPIPDATTAIEPIETIKPSPTGEKRAKPVRSSAVTGKEAINELDRPVKDMGLKAEIPPRLRGPVRNIKVWQLEDEEVTLVRPPGRRVRIDIDKHPRQRKSRSAGSPIPDTLAFYPTLLGRSEVLPATEPERREGMFSNLYVQSGIRIPTGRRSIVLGCGFIAFLALILFGNDSVSRYFQGWSSADSAVRRPAAVSEPSARAALTLEPAAENLAKTSAKPVKGTTVEPNDVKETKVAVNEATPKTKPSDDRDPKTVKAKPSARATAADTPKPKTRAVEEPKISAEKPASQKKAGGGGATRPRIVEVRDNK